MDTPPTVLVIAGSDSGGCAGIQADLRTLAALGVHGTTAITAVTAQDTCHVHRVFELPPALVEEQIEVIWADIGAQAVKTGMLASAPIIRAVADTLGRLAVPHLVVDPVMVSTGGDLLLRQDAVAVLQEKLFPLAEVITPNLREAEALLGTPLRTRSEVEEGARRLGALGPRGVLIKGGHLEEERAADCLFEEGRIRWLEAPRLPTSNIHGSGCTLASAIAAFLARGIPLQEACQRAKGFVTEAIRHSYRLGKGNGPLGHFWRFWSSD